LKRKHRGYGDTFYIDEVFVKINGKQHYLWRAVDQDGEVVDVFLQARRDGAAAVSNLFNLGRHLVRAEHYRDLRMSAFAEWGRAVA
jgi:transposase-like protein